MTPAELAHHGIPVEVALRAECEFVQSELQKAVRAPVEDRTYWLGALHYVRRALAIIEAKGKP